MVPSDIVTSVSDFPSGAKPPLVIGERDIVFLCPACAGELVVDQAGAGMTVPCPHCGQTLTIPESSSSCQDLSPSVDPAPEPSPAPVAKRNFDFAGQTPEQIERRTSELQHQLKENRSQDTEMRGHVNRATMELHRLQLRLKKLQERQADIEAELSAIQDFARAGG